ncbi:hypothetical protein PM082_019144 [Marasmius tenuissimus]|nr:hypothetical protein PM082_019144 [Marasmius tenuissimus]
MISQLLSTGHEARSSSRISTALVSHNRIPLVETSAKLYHAKFGADTPDWQYFHQKGKIVFGKDEECPPETGSTGSGSTSTSSLSAGHDTGISDAEHYWFRLMDPSTGKVDWLFPVPENFTYTMEKPFFHMFTGRSRLWGFLFEDDAEGNAFGEVVKKHLPPPTMAKTTGTTRPRLPPVRSRTTFRIKSLRSRQKSVASEHAPKVSAGMISVPRSNSFMHLGHIGLSRDGEVERSGDIDPSWARILTEPPTKGDQKPARTKEAGCFQVFI